MGDVDHGLRVIDEFCTLAKKYPFSFAFKLQYRELDTFIHPDFKSRTDIKFIKRFSETRLDRAQTKRLVDAIKGHGVLAMCTPFDEPSVDRIIEDGFDVLKVASCSFTDWPLLERMAKADLPIIASTAGIELQDIDSVVAFLSNRKKEFALETCVAEYPTPNHNLQLNQIDLMLKRYPGLRIGYSTHEDPNETIPVAMAIAKGATIFEKHIGIPTEKYALNNYSANPDQTKAWLDAAKKAYEIAGVVGKRVPPTKSEFESLFSLRRGAFAKRPIKKGERIKDGDVFFAIPTQEGHVTANDWSKYAHFYADTDIAERAPLLKGNTSNKQVRAEILSIANRVKALLKESNVVVPGEAELEISHHYGLEKFDQHGITMLTVVNRDYCKKLIVVLPGQNHPEQYHNKKEETFHVLHGELRIVLDGAERICGPGSVVTITPGMRHAFDTKSGAVFEEISSTHFVDDSFYTDPEIAKNKERKTFLRHWM
ncbi:N-acetylneuraminate synthase family protein [Terrarubrum flagellatum]|uniref:N-acetylneuraminate synthase family protein n=1 Tax=Terrirubrum flagellatum TaxID=2895980 RepID=UPI00314515D5